MKKIVVLALFLFCSVVMAVSPKEPWSAPVRWVTLQKYKETITAAEFEELLQNVYVPDGSWKNWITITPHAAFIEPAIGEERFLLPLAATPETRASVPRYWRRGPSAAATLERPLTGLRILLDPGHLGGSWAKMEERWFQIGHSMPVEEGRMALITAKILAKKLHALGAEVSFSRKHLGPTTPLRPHQLKKAALAQFQAEGRTFWSRNQLEKREELLFYRVAEIHHRANRINQEWQPDLVICLHFNADEWGNPKHPKLIDSNHLHFLIGGNFPEEELKTEEDRYFMLQKLLGRAHHEEVALANEVALSFVTQTELPPFIYHNPNKARQALPSSLYLWNRNLLATRLIQGPVLYCEPYVMNDQLTFQRIQLGDYRGTRLLGGHPYPSIYQEYANSVAQGVSHYFKTKLK